MSCIRFILLPILLCNILFAQAEKKTVDVYIKGISDTVLDASLENTFVGKKFLKNATFSCPSLSNEEIKNIKGELRCKYGNSTLYFYGLYSSEYNFRYHNKAQLFFAEAKQKGTLRIMTMNVLNSIMHGGWDDPDWMGTDHGRGDQVVRAIIKANPDILCVQEYLHNNRWIVDRLQEITGEKWYIKIYEKNCSVISRFPIEKTSNRFLAQIKVAPNKTVDIISAHIDVYAFLPYEINQKNISIEQINKDLLQNRNEYWTGVVKDLDESFEDKSIMTLVCGDFNEPSHWDFTPKAKAAGLIKRSYVCPLSDTLVNHMGMIDSYDQNRKSKGFDEVTCRGFSWSPTTWDYSQFYDDQRIDFIYYKPKEGDVKLKDSYLIGETPKRKLKGDKVDITIDPWPSDHRCFISVFSIDSL